MKYRKWRSNIANSGITAKGYDQGHTFMIVEIAGSDLSFLTIDAAGNTIDSGVVRSREAGKTN
jgi:hypothetical protein